MKHLWEIFNIKSITFTQNFAEHTEIMYNQSKKNKKKTFNSNTNYHREMKFEPINMDYCLLQFDALKFT